MPRSRPLQKVDKRSLEARRLKSLRSGLTLPEVQLAQMQNLAASLALEAERLECMQRNAEPIDPDLLVRVANALTRALDKIAELTPKSKYWTAPEELAEREERIAALALLSDDELLALRLEVAGDVPLPPPSARAPDYQHTPDPALEEMCARGYEHTHIEVGTTSSHQEKEKEQRDADLDRELFESFCAVMR